MRIGRTARPLRPQLLRTGKEWDYRTRFGSTERVAILGWYALHGEALRSLIVSTMGTVPLACMRRLTFARPNADACRTWVTRNTKSLSSLILQALSVPLWMCSSSIGDPSSRQLFRQLNKGGLPSLLAVTVGRTRIALPLPDPWMQEVQRLSHRKHAACVTLSCDRGGESRSPARSGLKEAGPPQISKG